MTKIQGIDWFPTWTWWDGPRLVISHFLQEIRQIYIEVNNDKISHSFDKNSAIWRDFRGSKSNGEKVKQKAKCEEEAKDEERKKNDSVVCVQSKAMQSWSAVRRERETGNWERILIYQREKKRQLRNSMTTIFLPSAGCLLRALGFFSSKNQCYLFSFDLFSGSRSQTLPYSIFTSLR